MHVFIMRHGEATHQAPSDAQRALTPRGREESQLVATWLAAQYHQIAELKSTGIERALVSPYLRAQQTFNVIKPLLPVIQETETWDALTPDCNPTLIADYLTTLATSGLNSVLVVSHLPLVGYLVADLCVGEVPPMFATSGLAQVHIDASTGQGTLLRLIQPSQLL
ncbi:MAG: phosphohistidine phosphatase SixA [Plesiomonas sp.]|uniref:phosphohistidine phosphatase SixA n=1 Tax=Plesiomonas sp. TaxID=2486279 RepID=UPI003F2CB8E4